MNLENISPGRIVTVQGKVIAIDEGGPVIRILDGGDMPAIGEFRFSDLSGIRPCPPTCSQCGMDMDPIDKELFEVGKTSFRCGNCGSVSGCS